MSPIIPSYKEEYKLRQDLPTLVLPTNLRDSRTILPLQCAIIKDQMEQDNNNPELWVIEWIKLRLLQLLSASPNGIDIGQTEIALKGELASIRPDAEPFLRKYYMGGVHETSEKLAELEHKMKVGLKKKMNEWIHKIDDMCGDKVMSQEFTLQPSVTREQLQSIARSLPQQQFKEYALSVFYAAIIDELLKKGVLSEDEDMHAIARSCFPNAKNQELSQIAIMGAELLDAFQEQGFVTASECETVSIPKKED